MKHTILATFALFLLGISQTISQELPDIIPPSPTVANLMQFEEVPVSYYTGQPDISIPIFNKALSNDLGVNIALSYNTQGIKIDNRSGWTGTGWTLQAGGVISRTVRGLPDEKRKAYGAPYNGTGVLHNDIFWNYDDINTNKAEFIWNAAGNLSNRFDYELDLFQFSVLGISGRFVIVKHNGDLEARLLSKDQNIDIAIDYHPTTLVINGFILTNTKGNRYYFDLVEALTTSSLTDNELQNGEFTGLQGQVVTNTSSWHLTKIETSNSQLLASFQYLPSDEQYMVSKDFVFNDFVSSSQQIQWISMREYPYNAAILPPKKSVTVTTSYGTTQKLSKIILRDSSEIEFLFDDSHPETSGAVLNTIVIRDRFQVENKRFVFGYERTDRLWLTSIEENAGTKTKTYLLDYIDKENLPEFGSSRDDWGYNVSGAPIVSSSTCNATSFDKDAIKKGLLQRITYPTGGVKEFAFEHNTITYQSKIGLLGGSNQAAPLLDNAYRDLNPDNWTSNGVQFSFDSDFDNSASNPNLSPELITIGVTHELIYKRSDFSIDLGTCENTTTEEDILFNSLIRIKGTGSNSNYVNNIRLEDREVRFTLTPGVYEIRLIFLDICAQMDIDFCFNMKTFLSPISKFVYGGGVRIKEIIFKDNIDTNTVPSRKISYDYTDALDKYRSSGAIDGNIMGLFKDYEQTYRRYLFELEEDGCHYFNLGVFDLNFHTRSKNLNIELTQGHYVGYKTVKVSEQDNGFTIYTFTSAQDYASPSGTFVFPYTPAPNIDYKRGLLVKKQIFAHSTIPQPYGEEPLGKLKETINIYDFADEEIVAPTYRLYRDEGCEWILFYSSDYNSYINDMPNNRMNQCIGQGGCNADCIFNYEHCGTPYFFISDHIKSGWAKLSNTTTKNYFYDAMDNQLFTETKQSFVYNPLNFQIKEQNTYFDEAGEEQHFRTKYFYPVGGLPSNYTNTPIIDRLNVLNKINEVLATESYKNGELLSQVQTHYFEPLTDLVLPEKVKTLKGTNTSEDRVQFYKYDIYGNPLEMSRTDGIHISYIWGYHQSYPVAKLEGITFAQIETLLGANFNAGDGALTTQQITSLKTAFPNAMVSTYTYDPLVGVTSMTDAKGYTMYYEYDEFNRLEHVKDAEGNILSKNEYKYATQN